jgi:hypothetical protein
MAYLCAGALFGDLDGGRDFLYEGGIRARIDPRRRKPRTLLPLPQALQERANKAATIWSPADVGE